MVVADARHLVHLSLHLQLTAVQNDAQVTNKTGRLNSGIGNGELVNGCDGILESEAWVPNQMNSDLEGLS